MGKQTVIGVFDHAQEAMKAVSELQAAGFSRESLDVAARGSENRDSLKMDSDHYNESGTMAEGAADAAGRGVEKGGSAIGRFFNNLFGEDEEEATKYSTVASRSGSILTVHCHNGENAHQAAEIMDRCGAVDVDERAAAYGYGSDANRKAAEGTESVKVIQEDLHVGKREVTTGGARLRSRIIERPVEENLRLREERVFVDREAVNRPATEADFNAFKEGTIELKETAEVPVVNKEARVVEEVRLGKETRERSETIRDSVRSTKVDVERIEGEELEHRKSDDDFTSTTTERRSSL